jgi:hypothetical protein
MRFLTIFILAILCFGCVTTSKNQLAGKWKLSEYLIDIGDGNGTWQPATAEMQSITDFFSDGKISSNDPLMKDADHFKMLKDSIQFSGKQLNTYSYTLLHPDTLVIRPHCVEACGFKYVRTQ